MQLKCSTAICSSGEGERERGRGEGETERKRKREGERGTERETGREGESGERERGISSVQTQQEGQHIKMTSLCVRVCGLQQ